MPDLGNYAIFILSSYGITLIILASLLIHTIHKNNLAKKKLYSQNQKKNES